MNILYAVLALSLMGLVFGVVLAFAAKVFAIKVDERIPKVIELLPGANCGGCGYTGCAAYASAIVSGKAAANSCTVGGSVVAKNIAGLMGVDAKAVQRRNAVMRCSGESEKVRVKFNYLGNMTCEEAARLSGGFKACAYSCVGYGSCVKVCPAAAISVDNGIARVDKEKCVACGKCVDVCPKGLFELMPSDCVYFVGCMSADIGAKTRENCDAGCIGCKICEKACKYGAITVTDSRAKINYSKCTSCGECAKKCPRRIIRINGTVAEADSDEGKLTDAGKVDKLIRDAGQNG